MANVKRKKLTPTQSNYAKIAAGHEPARPIAANFSRAFVAGGAICAAGQGIQDFYIRVFHFRPVDAPNPTVATLVLISVLLTGFGVYDRLAQWAGAGTAVPVTGFANSIASAALEHRSEGFVLGVGSNLFKIAGGVIVYGVVAAFFVALARVLLHAGLQG